MVTVSSYGTLPDGREAQVYTLQNAMGIQVKITNYGAALIEWQAPDREGHLANVVLGYPTLDGLRSDGAYIGATCGRYANRIHKGLFTLDGKTYQLAVTNGVNHLHGGVSGFDKKLWQAKTGEKSVTFEYVSPHGEESFPGTLTTRLTYTLDDAGQLEMHYEATTDAPTVLNITNHAYFNLRGNTQGDILDHVLTLFVDAYLPKTEESVPTGEFAEVTGTPFDFRMPSPIRDRYNLPHPQLDDSGFDHSFRIQGYSGQLGDVRKAAHALDPESGRFLEVWSTEPSIHLYTGYWLSGNQPDGNGVVFGPYSGFALEAQHYPDSPNQPGFPTTVLRPGEKYQAITRYKVGVN